MEKLIDLFSRLLIATITFVVPILINLLSSFAEGEKRRKELAKTNEEKLTKQAAEEIQSNPGTLRDTISRTHIELQKNDRETKKEVSLLNPVVQFWKIFFSLLASFVALSFNYLIRANQWGMYNHYSSLITITFAIIGYCIALFFIIRILYTVSRTKKMQNTI